MPTAKLIEMYVALYQFCPIDGSVPRWRRRGIIRWEDFAYRGGRLIMALSDEIIFKSSKMIERVENVRRLIS